MFLRFLMVITWKSHLRPITSVWEKLPFQPVMPTSLPAPVFMLTVNPVNDAPTVSATLEDQEAVEDDSFSYTIPANLFTDIDEDNITIATGDLPAWLAFDGSNFSGMPANGDVGSSTVEVTGNDGNGGSATASFTLTVTNVNDAPTVVDPVDDLTVDEDAVPVTIDLSTVFGDVDANDQLSFDATAGGSTLLITLLKCRSIGNWLYRRCIRVSQPHTHRYRPE